MQKRLFSRIAAAASAVLLLAACGRPPSGRLGRGAAAYHGGRHPHRTRRADASSPGQFPETDPRRLFFDSVLFHRVIADFMIQAGDPASRRAPGGHDAGRGRCGLPDSRRDRLSGAGAYARCAGRGPDFRRGESRTEILRQSVLHRLGASPSTARRSTGFSRA